jgi:hypothetical protein
VITKEVADYSYREKNNLLYFIFSPNSKNPAKAVIHHLPPPPYTQAEDSSNGFENLDFNVINVR